MSILDVVRRFRHANVRHRAAFQKTILRIRLLLKRRLLHEPVVPTVHLVLHGWARRGAHAVAKPFGVGLHQRIEKRAFPDAGSAAERDDARRRLPLEPFAKKRRRERLIFRISQRLPHAVVEVPVRGVHAETLALPAREPLHDRDVVGGFAFEAPVPRREFQDRLAQEDGPEHERAHADEKRGAEDVYGHAIVHRHASPRVHDPHSHEILPVRAGDGDALVILRVDVLPQERPGVDGIPSLVDVADGGEEPLHAWIAEVQGVFVDEGAVALVAGGFRGVVAVAVGSLEEHDGDGGHVGEEGLGTLPLLQVHLELLGIHLTVLDVDEFAVVALGVCVERGRGIGRVGQPRLARKSLRRNVATVTSRPRRRATTRSGVEGGGVGGAPPSAFMMSSTLASSQTGKVVSMSEGLDAVTSAIAPSGGESPATAQRQKSVFSVGARLRLDRSGIRPRERPGRLEGRGRPPPTNARARRCEYLRPARSSLEGLAPSRTKSGTLLHPVILRGE